MSRSDSDEDARLEALASYAVDEPALQRDLLDIGTRTAAICGTPMAGVILLERDRIRPIVPFGIRPRPLPRETSMTEYATFQDSLVVITNPLEDPRFANAPVVIGTLHVRFYASVPLITPEGHHIGVLALLDSVPRDLNPTQRAAVISLGREAMDVMEIHRRRGIVQPLSRRRSRQTLAAAAAFALVAVSTLFVVNRIRINTHAQWLERTDRAAATTVKLLGDRLAALDHVRGAAIRGDTERPWWIDASQSLRKLPADVGPLAFLPAERLSMGRVAYVIWLVSPRRTVADLVSVYPSLHSATAESRDEGRLIFTVPETWFPGLPRQPLIVAAIYDRALPRNASTSHRRKAALGWLLIPIDLESAIATPSSGEIAITVYDGRHSLGRRLLVHGPPSESAAPLYSERRMDALGETWIIEAHPARDATTADWRLYTTWIVGLLLAAVAAFAAHRATVLRLLTRP